MASVGRGQEKKVGEPTNLIQCPYFKNDPFNQQTKITHNKALTINT